MRKLFCILLTIGFLCVGSLAFAESAVNPSTDYVKISTYCVTNPDDTAYAGLLVSATDITTSDKIIGFSLTATDADQNAGISLWDNTSIAAATDVTGANTGGFIVEVEAKNGENSVTVWFPYPYRLINQLVIRGGDTGFSLSIFYIDVSNQ